MSKQFIFSAVLCIPQISAPKGLLKESGQWSRGKDAGGVDRNHSLSMSEGAS